MAKVVVKQKAKKVKRKFPVEVVAPEYLNSYVLGKSEVTDLGSLTEKTAKVNLMYITGNVKNQNVRLKFKVSEVSSGLAKTQVTAYEQIPYYLGRFVRKGSNLIEDSFSATTKDGIKVRVKPFIVTKIIASRLVITLVRKKANEVISKEIESRTYDEFMSSVISGRVQTGFRNEVKKIFPIKVFEFRKIESE